MLTSLFQTEQTVNTRFFMHFRMLSPRVDFKLPALCCFSVLEGRGRFFFSLLRPTAGRGEGDKEVALTSLSGLNRGQNL